MVLGRADLVSVGVTVPVTLKRTEEVPDNVIVELWVSVTWRVGVGVGVMEGEEV